MASEKRAVKSAARKAAGKQTGAKKQVAKTRTAAGKTKSMPKAGKDPKGGLTAKGRDFFNKKEGAHLRPGVQGPADTPEKMVRKGSFLRRHFANPRGPMKDEKGEPTRLALSAHAWGEPVPQTMADAKRLADKGRALLEKYHEVEGEQKGSDTVGKKTVRKTEGKKAAAKKAEATVKAPKSAAKAAGAKKAKSAAAKTAGGKATGGKAAPRRRTANS